MGRRSKRYVQARRKRMRKLPLSTMTRREVAELMGVSEVTVLRDERAIGRSCRIHTRAEISHLGVAARQAIRSTPTLEERQQESSRLMGRWIRLPIARVG